MIKNKPLKIFFAGIGGSGVSAIASFLADKGHVVAGSDRVFDTQSNHPLKNSLQKKGITIVPQDGKGLDRSFDCAVFSTAVEHSNPEFLKAKSLGIPTKTRSEYLAEIASSFTTIAVSGTSGKSTATGLLAFLMHRLGFEPNYIGGGRVKQFKSPSHPGNALSGTSEYLILEACESDGSIIQFTPQYSIILNLAFDHHPVHETAKMFQTLMSNTEKKVFINADDRNLGQLTSKNVINFSIQKPSPYRAEKIIIKQYSTEFSLQGTHFYLSLPGEYNLYNALSCIAFLSEIGIPLKDISSALPEFQGIDRRFNIYLNDAYGFVLDDYAHNPHKISSLMQTVKRLRKRICYIFQPHGYAPTKLLKKEYIEVFTQNLRDSDHLIILPIYYAGGTASKDISSADLALEISAQGKSVEVMEKRADIFQHLKTYHAYIIFGARDETLADFARELAGKLSE